MRSKEALTQERDGPEIHTLDPCYKGNLKEESEGKDEEMAILSSQPELELEKGKSIQPHLGTATKSNLPL